MVLLLLPVYNSVPVHSSLTHNGRLAQPGQGRWASCCESARSKTDFLLEAHGFGHQLSRRPLHSYLLKRKMLSFCFIHFIHSAKGKQPFFYSRMTCKQNNTSAGLILHLFARGQRIAREWCLCQLTQFTPLLHKFVTT